MGINMPTTKPLYMARSKSGRNGSPVNIYLSNKIRARADKYGKALKPRKSLSALITEALEEKFKAA